MNKASVRGWLLVVLFTLVACTTPHPQMRQPTDPSVASSAAVVPTQPCVSTHNPVSEMADTIQQSPEPSLVWHLQGRVAIKTPHQGLTAHLEWSQKADRAEIELQGPLGIGTLQMVLDARAVTITQKTKTVTYAVDDPQLTQFLVEQLSAELPLASLRYWLHGNHDPHSEWAITDNGFSQNGWRVHLEQKRHIDGPIDRLEIQNDTTRIRVIIDQWIN